LIKEKINKLLQIYKNMRWAGRRQSTNIEDRRGVSGKRVAGVGGIGALVIGVIIYFLGGDPSQVFNALGTGAEMTSEYQPTEHEEQLADFISVVLADTEDVWDSLFMANGDRYTKPTLVLFTDEVQSACGFASAATGPFYCSNDSRVYIDLGFLEQLQHKLNARGDFAQAYIVAHEVGHHVQNLLGILDQVHGLYGKVSDEEYNEMTVRLELQADFLAGVWAHHAQRMKNILESGDIEEAMNAADAVGDDRIQLQSQGYVVPDSFTHGTSAQRLRWFKKGFETGDISQGDTFGTDNL
jgi:predicted metalloprotease